MNSLSDIFGDSHNVFALYAAINGLIMLVLGILVVRARVATETLIGDGGNPAMAGPLRAHGNNTEWTPMAIVMMLVTVSLGAPFWILHLVGLPLTLGRLLHGIALSGNIGTSWFRLLGMLLTWIAYVVAIVAILWLLIDPAIVATPDSLQ